MLTRTPFGMARPGRRRLAVSVSRWPAHAPCSSSIRAMWRLARREYRSRAELRPTPAVSLHPRSRRDSDREVNQGPKERRKEAEPSIVGWPLWVGEPAWFVRSLGSFPSSIPCLQRPHTSRAERPLQSKRPVEVSAVQAVLEIDPLLWICLRLPSARRHRAVVYSWHGRPALLCCCLACRV